MIDLAIQFTAYIDQASLQAFLDAPTKASLLCRWYLHQLSSLPSCLVLPKMQAAFASITKSKVTNEQIANMGHYYKETLVPNGP